jgi:adenosylmethionine-8-amino-7-oxononanoate aminotransferase
VHEHGALLIADEVMTGFGRTGTLFAMDQSQEPADIICLSKGLTGGFLPLGATVVTEPIYQAFQSADKRKTFFHGHSYTANPIACAAALASLQLFQKPGTEENLARIAQAQNHAARQLNQVPGVASARSCGIILAVEYEVRDRGYLSQLAPKLYQYFLQRGLLLRPLGNVIYTMPPLCIMDDELDQIFEAIKSFSPVNL